MRRKHHKDGLIFSIKENSWIAKVAAWKIGASRVAIVIADTVHLHNTAEKEFLLNPRWLAHELEHVRQYKRHGTIRFILLYLAESIKNGYRNNRFELEARAAEDQSGSLET